MEIPKLLLFNNSSGYHLLLLSDCFGPLDIDVFFCMFVYHIVKNNLWNTSASVKP